MNEITEITFDTHTKPLIVGYLTRNVKGIGHLDTIINYLSVAMANKKFTIPAVFLLDDDLTCFVIRKLLLEFVGTLLANDNAEAVEQALFDTYQIGIYLELFQNVMYESHAARRAHVLHMAADTLGLELPTTDGAGKQRMLRDDGRNRVGLLPRRAASRKRPRKSTLLF
jgi:hypothetical protein